MNRRLLGNILIIVIIILASSGIAMYFVPFEKRVASLHTFFALLFIIAILFHIINNKTPLFNYISGKRQHKLKKLQAPFIFGIILLIATGLFFDAPFLNKLYNFGNELRNRKIGKTQETFDYQIIELENAVGNKNLSIELKKGSAFGYPLFAVWAEDSIGNYIETLYISKVISSSTFAYGEQVNGAWKPGIKRRPEALPIWSHKRGVQASDGLYVPLNVSPDLDAVTGATPTNNFIVKSKGNFNNLKNYRILVEINQSFDWNDYYTKDKFPNDLIYSGSGEVGQPSLVYLAEINPDDLNYKMYKVMRLIGHGHHSGKNGKLYQDVSNITSAKNIADRIILTID